MGSGWRDDGVSGDEIRVLAVIHGARLVPQPLQPSRRPLKTADAYHKWAEWSDEDGVYLGKCPDLITGSHSRPRVALPAQNFKKTSFQGSSVNAFLFLKSQGDGRTGEGLHRKP